MPSTSWHIHLKGGYSVPLAFELRQHVSKTSLKYLFILSLVFQRKNSEREGDRRIKWIRSFISNNNQNFDGGDLGTRQIIWNDSCPLTVARPKDYGQYQFLPCLPGTLWCLGSTLVSHSKDHPGKKAVKDLVSSLKRKRCPQNFSYRETINKVF